MTLLARSFVLLTAWAAAILFGSTAAVAETKIQVQVRLLSAAGAPLSGEGAVVFRGPSPADSVVVPTRLPGPAAAELPPGSQWTLVADFPGYFAPDSVFQVPRQPPVGPMEVQVKLRPAGTLTGKLVVAAKEKLPERLEARFEPTREGAPNRQDLTAGVATCAIGPAGEWRCRLPAGRLDIALHPKGFVPHYLWNVGVTAGKPNPIEPLKLVRGASIAGWITREDGTPAENCRVRLEPMAAPGRPNDPVLEFLRTVASETLCQKKGFFQFSALAPGSYALVAQEKDARAQMSPVEVWNGAESRLTIPIVLRRPADFEVTFSPPTDWLGRPWRLEARRANEYRAGWEETSFRAEASLEGRVKIPKQAPGRFWITVYDQQGNPIFSDPHVDLSDPAQPYPITLDLVWVEGKVRLGNEPLTGRLFFGGRSGATSIEMVSDAGGRFAGPLPKAGSWLVDIQGDEPRVKTSVKAEVKARNGLASVVIDLPDTKVYGRVVDAAGKPSPNAEVTLSSAVGSVVASADEKGEFEMRAFPKGPTEISAARAAEGGREVSDSYRFEAAGDSPHGPVVLTLRRNVTIRGRVVGAIGAVVGATVIAWPTEGGDGVASTVRSGLDGGFELKLPVGTRAVQAVVSPPGGALKTYETNVSSDAELLLQVEPSGGEVVVSFGKDEAPADRILALWQDEIGIPIGTLARWAEGHGVRFSVQQGSQTHIPQLAPGRYTVCLGASTLAVREELDAWKNRASCASGFLSAGSTLELRLHVR